MAVETAGSRCLSRRRLLQSRISFLYGRLFVIILQLRRRLHKNSAVVLHQRMQVAVGFAEANLAALADAEAAARTDEAQRAVLQAAGLARQRVERVAGLGHDSMTGEAPVVFLRDRNRFEDSVLGIRGLPSAWEAFGSGIRSSVVFASDLLGLPSLRWRGELLLPRSPDGLDRPDFGDCSDLL